MPKPCSLHRTNDTELDLRDILSCWCANPRCACVEGACKDCQASPPDCYPAQDKVSIET